MMLFCGSISTKNLNAAFVDNKKSNEKRFLRNKKPCRLDILTFQIFKLFGLVPFYNLM